jgi:hypothetical protein
VRASAGLEETPEVAPALPPQLAHRFAPFARLFVERLAPFTCVVTPGARGFVRFPQAFSGLLPAIPRPLAELEGPFARLVPYLPPPVRAVKSWAKAPPMVTTASTNKPPNLSSIEPSLVRVQTNESLLCSEKKTQ